MLIRISGGTKARNAPPLMILKNKDLNCPIRSTPDSVLGVDYRTGTKWWIDPLNMLEWLIEPRAIKALTNGKLRNFFY